MKKYKKIISLIIAVNFLTVFFHHGTVLSFDKMAYKIDNTIAASLVKLARELMDIMEDCHIDRHLGSQNKDYLEDKEFIEKAWRNTTFLGLNPELLVEARTATRLLVDSLARLGLLLKPLASNNSFPNSQNCNQRILDFFSSRSFNEFREWRNRQRTERNDNVTGFGFDPNPEFGRVINDALDWKWGFKQDLNFIPVYIPFASPYTVFVPINERTAHALDNFRRNVDNVTGLITDYIKENPGEFGAIAASSLIIAASWVGTVLSHGTFAPAAASITVSLSPVFIVVNMASDKDIVCNFIDPEYDTVRCTSSDNSFHAIVNCFKDETGKTACFIE